MSEIKVGDKIDLEATNSVVLSTKSRAEVTTAVDNTLDVTVTKKEYKIVGDEVYIAKLYEDAPQWMKDLVQMVVDKSLADGSTSLVNDVISRLNQFATSYVPLNTYTQSILDLSNADTSIHATLETLNSAFDDKVNSTNAQIITLNSTKASKDEVVAKVIETLAAQLMTPTSELGATIANLQQTIVDGDSANAESYTTLVATLDGLDGNVSANAAATQYLNTYVGINSVGALTGTGALADIQILQKQNDGVIETYTGTYDVILNATADPELDDELVLTAEPYATWLASEAVGSVDKRLSHIGDVYIKYETTSTGAKAYIGSYKFIRAATDSTSPYSTDADGFTWALIVDQAAQNAYMAALNAHDLANGKRRIYVGLGAITTPNTPYDQGDLWLIDSERIVNGYQCKVGDILRCIETKSEVGIYEQNDWVLASSYVNAVNAQNELFQNFVSNDYAAFVSNIQTQVDGKAETFYQNSVPTGRIKSLNVPDNDVLNKYIGDLWKNTYVGTISGYLGDNTEYIYTKKANGANWDYDWAKMEVPDIVFDTIDTKKSIYRGNSVPVAVAPDVIEVNDMWITGSDVVGYDKESIYIWSGSAWVKPLKYTDDTATAALQNGLADGTVTVKLTKAFVGTTPFLTYLTSEIDSKVGVYSGETAPIAGQPSGVAVNDIYLWFTTASKVLANGTTQVYDITRTYKYSGSAWNEITTDSNITALADLADGKRSIFSGSIVPTVAVDRDIWIPSADVDITTSGMCAVAGGTWNGTTCSITKYLKGEIYQYSASKWQLATKYTENLNTFVSEVNPKITTLQEQSDGKIEYWFNDTATDAAAVTTQLNSWKAGWTTSTLKNAHVGDIGVFTKMGANGIAYVYTSGYVWEMLTDNAILKALMNAAKAQASADNIVVSYYAQYQDSEPDTSKLWLNKTGTKVLKHYTTSWTNVVVKEGDTLTAFDPVSKEISIFVYSGSSWASDTPDGLVAASNWGVALDAYLKDPVSGEFGGSSTLTNSVKTTSNGVVSTAFTYNAGINNVGGKYYNAGFGLVTNSGLGTVEVPYNSEFWVNADKFKVSNGTTGYTPFSIVDNNLLLNGLVRFTNTSGGSSTLQDVVQSYVETVQVGDKNVNITDNLIPMTSMLADTNNAGYQFIGTPTKTSTAGISVYSEPQVQLDVDDELYSPFVDELSVAYYYRFGIKGVTALTNAKICTINTIDAVTYGNISYTMDVGQTLVGTDWYIIDGLINPAGGSTGTGGSIRKADGTKIGTVDVYVMPAGSTKLLLGWIGACTVSRCKLAKVNADTVTGDLASIDYVNSAVGNLGDLAYENVVEAAKLGSTVIDGGYIKSSLLTADNIVTGQLNANRLAPTSGTSTVWSGGGLVSSNFNGNSAGSIGTPTQGFRLSSNAAGTSADPNIYGGYIKGSTFEAIDVSFGEIHVKSSTMPLTNSGAISYTMNSGYLYGSSYSTGYLISRVCGSTSQILIRGSMDWSCSNVTSYDFSASLQYSIDDGTWVTLDSGREYFINYASYISSAGRMNLYGLLSGSAVPSTSTISFRMLKTSSTGGSTSGLEYTVTLTNS